MWVWTREMLRRSMIRIMGSDTITAAPLKNSVLGLLKDPYAPTDVSVYAGDVKNHEANFNGYALSAPLVWNGPYVGEGDKELAEAGSLLVQPTGSTTINSVTGQFLLAADSTTLLGVEMFDQPIPLPDAAHAFTVVPITGLPNDGQYGLSIVQP